jgi:hypothetical protein
MVNIQEVLNTEEEEPKRKPDLRLYVEQVDQEGNKKMQELCALWSNKSKKGETYYTGKLGKVRIVGFNNK